MECIKRCKQLKKAGRKGALDMKPMVRIAQNTQSDTLKCSSAATLNLFNYKYVCVLKLIHLHLCGAR